MKTHTSKIIPAPGLAAMLSALGTQEVGHPGEGWWSALELARTASIDRTHMKMRCDKLVALGTYEKCQRKIGRSNITFYRLKEVPGKCSTTATNESRVRKSLPTRNLPGKPHALHS